MFKSPVGRTRLMWQSNLEHVVRIPHKCRNFFLIDFFTLVGLKVPSGEQDWRSKKKKRTRRDIRETGGCGGPSIPSWLKAEKILLTHWHLSTWTTSSLPYLSPGFFFYFFSVVDLLLPFSGQVGGRMVVLHHHGIISQQKREATSPCP